MGGELLGFGINCWLWEEWRQRLTDGKRMVGVGIDGGRDRRIWERGEGDKGKHSLVIKYILYYFFLIFFFFNFFSFFHFLFLFFIFFRFFFIFSFFFIFFSFCYIFISLSLH